MKLKMRVSLAFLLVLPAMSAIADTVRLATGHPDEYVVSKGDTLWDISGRFLEQPWRWPEVWKINPQIENPHLIYPGDRVRLVYEEGRPYLELERGGVSGETAATRRMPADRYLKLRPQIRAHPNSGAIKSLPLQVLRPFLSDMLVVEEEEVDSWPYVFAVGARGRQLLAGETGKVYLRGELPEDQRRYQVYRQEKELRRAPGEDGEPGELLGYRASLIGTVEILKRGDPAVAVVLDTVRAIRPGDRLRVIGYGAVSEEELMDFVPHSPAEQIRGHIVDVLGGVRHISQYQVVILDVGKDAGLDPGSVVSLYQASGTSVKDEVESLRQAQARHDKPLYFKGEEEFPATNLLSNVANDLRHVKQSFDKTRLGRFLGPGTSPEVSVQLPAEYLGSAMVFRSFSQISYALVMEVTQSPVLYDRVSNPR